MRPVLASLIAGVVAANLPRGIAWADEPLPPAAFGLREAGPTTGGNLRRDTVTGSSIPLNRRYREMSAEEQARVRSLYDPMPAGDEPPFPVDGLAPVYRDIQKIVQKLQTHGAMTLVVEVDPRGDAAAVQVLKSDDPELSRAIASVLMLTKYKAAACAGKPCAMAFPFRIDAVIRH